MALVKQRHPGLPRVLIGHSMGGLIALRYAIDNPDSLCGAVISSPALGTHPDFQPPKILQWLVGILSVLVPRLRVNSNLDTHAVSRDPAVVNAYEADPLISQKVSVRFYSAMMKAISDIHGNAPGLKIPTLLMQSGGDRLVDPQATAIWAEKAGDNVELVIWEGLYHEMFNEPEKDEVLSRLVGWLKQFTVD
jgi:alpha-beta hydrolase superfamily lysophospholipase